MHVLIDRLMLLHDSAVTTLLQRLPIDLGKLYTSQLETSKTAEVLICRACTLAFSGHICSNLYFNVTISNNSDNLAISCQWQVLTESYLMRSTKLS